MKDHLMELVSQYSEANMKLNIMREYLQAYALRALFEQGLFHTTAFVGGTALRFLYDLPRYSEDLDFSLVKPISHYVSSETFEKLKTEFLLAGYEVSMACNDRKVVHTAFLRFSGIMFEARISPLPAQKLSIRIEIDTRPPEGAHYQRHLITRYFPMAFLSLNISSLFTGKIHALLSRKYTKGRDFFDLMWYLSRWRNLTPNFPMLENALKQTAWKGNIPKPTNWKVFLRNIVKKTNWDTVKKEIENLLEDPVYLDMFSKENLLELLKHG